MPTPTTADVLKQYRDELARMKAAGEDNTPRYSDYQQRINELELEQYQENKARDAAAKQGKKRGGKVSSYSCGGKVKKMASGGKVRGCGAAKRGVKKAKMY